MAAELTVARLRDAVMVLRVVYLPLMKATHDEVWQDNVDLSEPLATFVERQADAIESLCRDGGPATLQQMAMVPEYVAFFALVEKILGGHA